MQLQTSGYIDPHVHGRDGPQREKETLSRMHFVAKKTGAVAIFEMPNTDPPILTVKLAQERIALAKSLDSPVYHGLHIGVTSDPDQIGQAVEAVKSLDEVVGMKLYAGHSTGNLGVVSDGQQRTVFDELTNRDYRGVIVVHAEDEAFIDRRKFDYTKPWTHCIAQPPEAEVESVGKQIKWVYQTGFKGKLHFAHISVPDSVEIIESARKEGMNVSCEITPHHLLLCEEDMHTEDGLIFKVNPPLRPRYMMMQMRQKVSEGKVDVIGTDHAPHTLDDKLDPAKKNPFASGMPGLPFYPRFVEWLEASLLTPERVRDMTFNNINRIYGSNFQPKVTTLDMEEVVRLASLYPYDPYRDNLVTPVYK